jgi:L-threonylcarbamoyladenylate synthase
MVTTAKIEEAAIALTQGKIIAYPTEAVFGLGCDPFNKAAVEQLLKLKNRQASKGLILIAHNWEQVAHLITSINETAMQRAQATWPGPVTWIFPAADTVPSWIRGDHTGIALRITKHPIASALCQAFGGAIVSTSANSEGAPPAKDVDTLTHYFTSGIDVIMEGALGDAGNPTTIRDVMTGETIRV